MADLPIKDLVGASAEFDITYNGYQFGPLCRYSIQASPQYDPAGRTLSFTKYVLTVVSWQYASTENDMSSIMRSEGVRTGSNNLRERLMEPRARLEIADIGWGDTDTHNNYSPIVWGPKPLGMEFQPLGGGVCWQLTWRCEFGLNECASRNLASVGGSPLVLFNYDVAYAHDDLGFTTRTINAVLQIPQHGRTKKVNDTPENYRGKIRIPVPYGFRQTSRTERVNAAQNELHVSVTHEQLRTEAPPVGFAKCNVSFSTHGRAAGGGGILSDWVFGVQGSMETLPGFPKSLAAARFFQIAYSRHSIVKQALRRTYRSGATPVMLIASVDMQHEPWTRSSTFRMSWVITGAIDGQLFNPSVLYAPLTKDQSDYSAWVSSPFGAASLQRLWAAGGQTALRTISPDLVDLCGKTYEAKLRSADDGKFPLGGSGLADLPSSYFNCQDIAPESSWLAYEPVTELRRDNSIHVYKRDIEWTLTPFGTGPQQSYRSTGSNVNQPYDATPDVVANSGLPEQRLIFKGKAVRVHYPVSVPVIRSIEGVELKLMKNVEDSTPFAQLYGGCALHVGRWLHVYRPMQFLPGRVISMPRPDIKVESTAQ